MIRSGGSFSSGSITVTVGLSGPLPMSGSSSLGFSISAVGGDGSRLPAPGDRSNLSSHAAWPSRVAFAMTETADFFPDFVAGSSSG